MADIKLKLRNRANFKKTEGLDLAFPINEKPQLKTIENIEKHNILERYAHSLNNLKMYKENIQSKSGTCYFTF